ncbi:MAG: DUF4845 domain-containing protein [Pseudomonadota bacterium]
MRSLLQQRGMSIPGMLIIAIMVGFFVMCAIKMVPRYLEYLSVKKIVTTIAQEYNPDEQNLGDIRRRVDTMFNTNQIYDLQPKDVEIFHEKGKTYIDANYEVRVPVVGIIDAVMTFDDLQIETDRSRY